MFDRIAIRVLNKPMHVLARACVYCKLTPTVISLCGLLFGIFTFFLIIAQCYIFAVFTIIINRILDGLDGNVARIIGKNTIAGGYLDLVCDFIFYGIVPLAHGLVNPDRNLLPACIILFAFLIYGINFLATASVAHKLQMQSTHFPQKKIYYPSNIIEGSETIIYIIFVTLVPRYFSVSSYVLAGILFLSIPFITYIRFKNFKKNEKMVQ